MARPIVIGQITPGPTGLKLVNFWARIPIVAVPRQQFYAARQIGQTPAAPGDYAGADLQEASDFHLGLFREAPLFDVIDPSLNVAQVEARLVNLRNAVLTSAAADDTSLLSFYGTFWDGTTWTTKSA